MSDSIVTCVFCGHTYPDGTPTAKNELLTEHIRVCEKHPMREAEKKIEKLKSALLEELDAMEAILRTTTMPVTDKNLAINAIDTLRTYVTSV